MYTYVKRRSEVHVVLGSHACRAAVRWPVEALFVTATRLARIYQL